MTDKETAAALSAVLNSMVAEAERHTQQVRADVQHFQEIWLGMESDTTPQDNRLTVPWIGQNTTLTTDDYSNSDCGPACVAMWLNFVGRVVTVDQVSQATGLPRDYRFTLPATLIKAAGFYGLTLERVIGFTIDALKYEIDKRVPCIVLVHYGSLPKRSSQTFTGGHWLIIVGYDEQGFIYHDPYWPDSSGGAFLHATYAQLSKAMQDCIIDGNTPNQGLRSRAR